MVSYFMLNVLNIGFIFILVLAFFNVIEKSKS